MRAWWLLVGLAGCPKAGEPVAAAPTETSVTWEAREGVVLAGQGPIQVRTELVFGRAKPEGEVTDAEWAFFLDEVVTPRFPDGYTVLDAQGRWRGDNGELLQEPARVIVVVHAPSAAMDRAIDQIRGTYVARFEQEGVLRISTPALSSF